jgi:hypothetical protein
LGVAGDFLKWKSVDSSSDFGAVSAGACSRLSETRYQVNMSSRKICCEEQFGKKQLSKMLRNEFSRIGIGRLLLISNANHRKQLQAAGANKFQS